MCFDEGIMNKQLTKVNKKISFHVIYKFENKPEPRRRSSWRQWSLAQAKNMPSMLKQYLKNEVYRPG